MVFDACIGKSFSILFEVFTGRILFWAFQSRYLTGSSLVAMRESIALKAPGAGAVVAAGQVAALRLRVAARQPQAALVYVGASRVGPHHCASEGAV
jgi:hypothetical protein